MANKWADYFEIISDSAQFVERGADGTLRWVPSVGYCVYFFIQKDIAEPYIHKPAWEIPLTPPKNVGEIQLTGNEVYNVSDLCASTIYALVKDTDFLKDLSVFVEDGSALAGCENGRYLGRVPAILLSRALKEDGYDFETSNEYPEYPLFYHAGRGKRTLTTLFSVHKHTYG